MPGIRHLIRNLAGQEGMEQYIQSAEKIKTAK